MQNIVNIETALGWEKGTFDSPHHKGMLYAHAPALGAKRATIVLTTGYDESISHWEHVAARYQQMGAEVWLMNWHGHGELDEHASKPLIHDYATIMQHADDLDFFVKNIVRHDGKTPLVTNTHSIGGHIGMLNLFRFPGTFDAAIMATPFFDHFKFGLPTSARPAFMAAAYGLTHMGLKHASLEPVQKLVKDALRFTNKAKRFLSSLWNSAANEKGPEAHIKRLLYKSKMPTVGCVDTLLRSVALMTDTNFIGQIDTPLLIATTSRDTIVDNDVTREVAGKLPHVTHVHIKGADHRLFAERPPAVEEWWGHVSAFLEHQISEFKPVAKDPAHLESDRVIRSILLDTVLPKPR